MKARVMLAGVVAVAGVVVALRAIYSPLPASPTAQAREEGPEGRGLAPFEDLEFEAPAGEGEIEDVCARVYERIVEACIALEPPLNEVRAREFASLIEARLDATLRGDQERLGALAMEAGAVRFGPSSEGQGSAYAASWADAWRSAPVSLEHVAVRRYEAGNEAVIESMQTGIGSRSPWRGRYPAPPAGASVIEACIPMRPTHDGEAIAAFLGIAMRWDDAVRRWVGVNSTAYTVAAPVPAPPM